MRRIKLYIFISADYAFSALDNQFVCLISCTSVLSNFNSMMYIRSYVVTIG